MVHENIVADHRYNSIKNLILLATAPIRGIKPMFNEFHIIKTLLLLYEKEPIGRQLLSRYLGISITTARTLVKRLRSLNLIDVDPIGGCILTDRGREIVKRILEIITNSINVTRILDSSLLLYEKAFAFLIRRGIELLNSYGLTTIRDTIIKHGGIAVLIIYIMNNYAFIPPCEDYNENTVPSLRKLRDILGAKNNDVIIVIFANDERNAEKAFFHTVLELNIL